MSDYTPTAEKVREVFAKWAIDEGVSDDANDSVFAAAFDRWLAEVKAAAAAEALRDAADDIERNSLPSIKRDGMNVRFAVMLRARADSLAHPTP